MIESEHPDKVRMLVLETDDPHPETQEEIGSFGEVLNEVLVRAGEQHDPKLAISTIIHYAVEPRGGRIPEPSEITDDIHAILITGSVYDAHSNDAWVLKLMDLIKRTSRNMGIRNRANITRSLDSPTRHQVHRYMFWPPNTVPGFGINCQTERGWRLGTLPYSYSTHRCGALAI